ncbi:S41 family peptidase [Marinobacter changyiensis]|uniref:S41 family peptidase n=1 Tax=Marinobacter changyiensis TaxID=2604091 RepID=UPI001264F4D9|nr:S41 family peptidase [Marinobacter changyiensis]
MKTENSDKAARAAESFSQLQGVWRSQGYGKVLLIDGDRYVFFEETAISCRKLYSGTLPELGLYYEDVQISPGRQAFSAHRATGVTRVGFRRLKELPPAVFDERSKASRDPEYNFDVFWHTFAEHYALFELKGVAWEQSYRTFRPRIAADCPRETLFANMAAMLRPLRDGHIRLHTPWGHYGAGARPALYKRLESELEGAQDDRGIANYLGELRERLHEIIQDDYLRGGIRHGANHTVDWGRLSSTTGYLNIRAMAGQSGKIGHPADDLTATAAVMTTILTELGDLPNLVVDIRGNGGGYDGVALHFASHLMDRKRFAFSKSARHGNGFTGQQKIHVTPPATETYRGNLYVLTSELTASAAEIFVLALLQHPRLTLIGEPTQGILSDTLERHLPNGWHFTLSNEIYRAYDGQLYEDVGIPPHIRLQFLGRKGREQERDPMLDRVLKLVGA